MPDTYYVNKIIDRIDGTAAPWVDVAAFGAKGDGSTNDTAPINAAIAIANADGRPLFFPSGTYAVTPGGLTVITVSILAQDAIFEAADATDSYLLAVNYVTGRSGTNSTPTAFIVDVAGFVGSSSFSGVGTGLYWKDGSRCKVIVRQTNWLKYGVHIDTTWTSGAPMPSIVENYFWIKSDSGTVGLQISTSNDSNGVPIDSNYFYMGCSFNHTTAIVRVQAGTTADKSNVHNNVFEHEMLEIGQTNSSGILLTGRANGNKFIIHNMRGRNGTGLYGSTDSNSTNNLWIVMQWLASEWSFNTNQQVYALNAQDGTNAQLGRSWYWGPSTSVVGTTPSIVGDVIWHSDPGIGDNLGWVCTTAGSAGTWTAFGMRRVPFCGMTSTGITLAAGGTTYFPISGSADHTTSNNVAMPCSVNGTLRYFRVKSNTAPGAGQTYTFTLVKNGSTTAVVVTISNTDTTGSDLSSTLAVAAGDTLDWQIVSSAGAAANPICAASMDLLTDP